MPEAKLGGDAPAEVGQQRLAVGPLGRRRQTEQHLGLQQAEDALVGVGRSVMALVDDDEPEVVRRQTFPENPGGALDRREDVFPLLRNAAVDIELAERVITEHLAKRRLRLLEDLAAVGQKEESRSCLRPLTRAQVVEGRDDRLARAGRSDDEIAMPTVQRPLRLESIEDLELEWERLQREERDDGRSRRLSLVAKGEAKALAAILGGGVVWLELGVVPEPVERPAELVDDAREVRRADLHHPLEPATEGGSGEVGRSDVRGVQPGASLEEPRLCVKPRASNVVRDADLGTGQGGDRVDGIHLGGPGEHGREEPDPRTAPRGAFELLAHGANAAERHEGGENVDRVRRRDLA